MSRHLVCRGRGKIFASTISRYMPSPIREAAVAEVKAEGIIKPDGANLSSGLRAVPASGRRPCIDYQAMMATALRHLRALV